PEALSRAQLGGLFEHSPRPDFVYRHQWKPRDMVFWDNRSVMHLATPFPQDQRRKLYRTTIEGDVPF
uniref:TauD/TfdA dioxygenase family protein n=1 Tax=Massilia alkalitolerans TaxID=286638 RepID=UPI0028AE3482